MSNSFFQFKQFRIEQGDCAMKITTDACVLGAWAPIPAHASSVLDIGAGTGLLSLMLAQRNSGLRVDGIELDEAAATQAVANAAATVWRDRVNIMHEDACRFVPAAPYDLIISNPPFFNNSLLNPVASKAMARHTTSLSYADLLGAITNCLAANGVAVILLPQAEYLLFRALYTGAGWCEQAALHIQHAPGAAAKRVVTVLGRQTVALPHREVLVIKEGNDYSAAFRSLLSPFYLAL